MSRLVRRNLVKKGNNNEGKFYVVPDILPNEVIVSNGQAAQSVAAIAGEEVTIHNYDTAQQDEPVDFSKMTKLQRLRSALRKLPQDLFEG